MLKMLEGHTRTVSAVAISTEGRIIVSGSHDMTVRVWSAENWQVSGRMSDCCGLPNNLFLSLCVFE